MQDRHDITDIMELVGKDPIISNNIIMKDKFDFLFSPRFWQLFLAGVAVGIQVFQSTQDLLSAISAAIGSWLGASVIVGTVDRNADKKLEAAVVTGQVSG